VEPICADAPKGLDAVLSKALAKEPHQRYATAQDFAIALRTLQSESESELRAKLAQLLRGDFGREMSELLGLESLADRDDAWRRLAAQRPDNDAEPLLPHELVMQELYGSSVSSASGSNAPSGSGSDSGSGRGRPAAPPTMPPPPARASSPPTTAGNSAPPTSAPRRASTSRGFRASAVPPPPPSTRRQADVPTMRIREPAPYSPRALVLPLVALGLGALVSYAVVARHDVARGAAKTAVVVEPLDPPHADPKPAEVVDAAAPVAREADPPRDDAPRSGPRRGGKRGRGGADPRALSAAFSAQRARIETCFNAADVSVQGVATLSMAFDVDPRGRVVSARVNPPAVANTGLGRCLAKVGASTSFPASGQPISFSIPVSARKGR
jgi:hypothetical protein